MAWTVLNISLRKFCTSFLQTSTTCRKPSLRNFTTCFRGSTTVCRDQTAALLVNTQASKCISPFSKGFDKSILKQLIRGTSHVFYKKDPVIILIRQFSTTSKHFANRGGRPVSNSNTTGLIYIMAVFILMVGGAYAAVPLYKVFCQVSGLGGQAQKGHDIEKVEHMQKVEDRQIRVRFNADVASSMRWNFRPQQTEVVVAPGETALAFYTAKNPTDKPIIGISTYNVLPYDAGQYFNKIQCFCFEEQRLNPNEQVDMPVFFYIDPEFAEDPKLENINAITLSYTFFEAKEGLNLPLPGYPQPHDPPMPA